MPSLATGFFLGGVPLLAAGAWTLFAAVAVATLDHAPIFARAFGWTAPSCRISGTHRAASLFRL